MTIEMNKLDEIALRVVEEIPIMFNHIDLDKDGHLALTKEDIVTFAHALLAELSKDAEPVGFLWRWKSGILDEGHPKSGWNFSEEYPEMHPSNTQNIDVVTTFTHPANTAEIEQKPKQPWPNHNWCVGCDPSNCSGCGTEPIERRKETKSEIEQRVAEAIAHWIRCGDHYGVITSDDVLAGKWREHL